MLHWLFGGDRQVAMVSMLSHGHDLDEWGYLHDFGNPQMYIYIYIDTDTNTNTYTYHIRIRIRIHICIRIHTRLHLHIHINVYIYIHNFHTVANIPMHTAHLCKASCACRRDISSNASRHWFLTENNRCCVNSLYPSRTYA